MPTSARRELPAVNPRMSASALLPPRPRPSSNPPFAISAEGQWLTIAAWELLFSIMVTEALPGEAWRSPAATPNTRTNIRVDRESESRHRVVCICS
jgi:hypothetical protein